MLGNGLEGELDFSVQLTFLNNPGYPQFEKAGENQRVGNHGQNQDLHVRKVSLQVVDQPEPVTVGRIPGHVVVGDDKIHGLLLDEFDQAL
ncbi:hypothetical protein D3C71_2017780 [compost metagenome]